MYNFFMDGVQLPIAPPSMSMKISNKNETIILINEGEVNLLKKAGLTDIEFEVLLPNVQYPFAVYPNGFQPASFYLKKLEQLKVSQKPFPFIVNRMMPNGKLLFDIDDVIFSLEDYEIQEDAENGFDITVQVNLKQYRPYGTKKIEIKKPATSGATAKATVVKQRDSHSKEKKKSHTVVAGDTLWAIAKRELGDGSKYPELAKLNNLTNPNLIIPGQVIRLE